jgi:hypothetical protein
MEWSMNKVANVQANPANSIEVAEEKASYANYTLLGSDKNECDVEYAIFAQAEVMLEDANGGPDRIAQKKPRRWR